MKLNLITACSYVVVHTTVLAMYCALWGKRTYPQRIYIDDWPKEGHAQQTPSDKTMGSRASGQQTPSDKTVNARASAQQTPSDKTVGCKSQCKGGKKDFNSVLKTWASRHFSAEASPCTTEYD